MTLNKSNYSILTYLGKNIEMKAFPASGSGYNIFMCYLPEMNIFIGVQEYNDVYKVSKLAASLGSLDRKNKKSWNIEKLSALDQKMIQEYIKHDGNIYEFRKSDFDERT